ncbi:MAG: amidase [Vulcanimicrobiaceae bacterium]
MSEVALSIGERARALLDRIEATDAQLRCFVAVDREAVLREARRLDAVDTVRRGPLHGYVLAVKDIIDVAGLPTRAGSGFFRRDPDADAPVVQRLRHAGALVIGKTNTHEFAWGITTENPHFGRTGNPWDPARIAGGSSGGSGAAVAAGLADIALGTDTWGSIRIPAALCGVVGIRPPTGALSLEGIVPLAIGLDTVGPFARDVATVRAAYAVLSGDGEMRRRPQRVCRLRGGAWENVHFDVVRALDALVARLAATGVPVTDVHWWRDDLVAATGVVQQHTAAQFHAPMIAEHRAAYGEDVRARVERALEVSDDDLTRARATIAEARASWRETTMGYTCALAPVVGDEAPLAPAPASFREATMPLVTAASAFGLASLALPLARGAHDMPLGLQIIALTADPQELLEFGAAVEPLVAPHPHAPFSV